MSYNAKPENAFRRAQELISIGQPEAALATLHETISNRRHRTWSLTYEEIMITYIDLCLGLNKSREAKDGLHQYRNLSQAQAPGSLENVVKYLIEQSEAKCKEAKEATSGEIVVDDLDDSNGTPDANNIMLLSTMTADPAKVQRESMVLLPKIKFLWEAYRAVLDILKSNSKLERLYHSTAVRALNFCAEYKRRTEFRRLSDLLRMHLGNLQKYGGVAAMAKVEEGGKPNNRVRWHMSLFSYSAFCNGSALLSFLFLACFNYSQLQVRGWEGWSSESIELQLQTRFTQLETASLLHLYTEGFRTVEDIFNILQISLSRRKVAGGSAAPKAKIMAAYYEKLTTLFWVSENYLFHAFAWYKFYTLCKEFNRGMTDEQKKFQASSVLLAALCIPTLPDKATTQSSDDGSDKIKATVQDDIAKEKTARMATLLGFHTRNPTREALLSEIRAKNVMADVPDYLRALYKLLEENNDPLVLIEKAKPLLDELRAEAEGEHSLNDYVNPIVSVLLMKLMHALSASYHTISLDHIKSLTAGLGVTFTQVEKAIIACANSKSTTPLRVRIDHRAKCLRFGDASGCAPFESDTMRSQLTNLASQLNKVCSVINPADMVAIDAERKALYADVRAAIAEEHEEMITRKELIESRKEESERLAQEKLKAQERKRLEAMAHAKAEEERRLQREQKLREKEKLEKIKKEMELTEKKKILKAMGQNVESMTENELETIDANKLAKEHAAKAAKKKNDAERKVREVQKKLDYIVRATRIEEMPIIKKRYEESVKEEKTRYEAEVIKKAKRAKLQWEEDCKSKKELADFGVFAAMRAFEKVAMEGRISQHQISCEEEDRRAENVAEMAKLKRARKRKDDEIRLQKEEEARIKKEAEEKKAAEERQKREEERRRKEMAQEEARRIKEAERQAASRYSTPATSAPTNAPKSSALENAAGGKYVPPSRRSGSGGGRGWGNSGGGDPGSRNAWGGGSRGNSFGGGRYEGSRGGYDRDNRDNRDRDGGSNRYSRDRDRAPEPRSNSRWS